MTRKFERNKICEFIIQEASFDDDCSNGRIQIIESGFNGSKSRFYTQEAIEKGTKVFEGAKMYVNHDFDGSQVKKHGARDIMDWVATIQTTESAVNKDGKMAGFGKVVIESAKFKEFLQEKKEHGSLDKVGVSVDALARGERRKMEGVYTNVIEGFVEANSVDFVSAAGAGGKMLSLKEAYYENEEGSEDMKIEDLNMDELKEKNPKFLESLLESAEKSVMTKIKEADDAEAKKKAEGDKKGEAKKEEEPKAEDKNEEAAKESLNKRFAQVDRKEIVVGVLEASSLPVEAKDRIRESINVSDVVMDGDKLDIVKTKESIAKTIESEESYIKKLTEAKSPVKDGGSGEGEEDKEEVGFIKAMESACDDAAGIEPEKKDKDKKED